MSMCMTSRLACRQFRGLELGMQSVLIMAWHRVDVPLESSRFLNPVEWSGRLESDIWTAWVWVIAICSTSGTFIDRERETELLFSCTFNFFYISWYFTWAHDSRDTLLTLYMYVRTWLSLTLYYVLSRATTYVHRYRCLLCIDSCTRAYDGIPGCVTAELPS